MTIVLAPPRRPGWAAPPAPPRAEQARGAPLHPGWRGVLVRRWPVVLALVALAVYVWAGCFMLYDVHYAIGDAMARSQDARAVLFSRYPHLAAWGFVWFPLPVVLELPFMAVVSPLQHAALAGPLSTATCGALTVLVLVKLFRRLVKSELLVAGLAIVYCLNPVIVFYAANGMSEASFYLAAAVFLLGIVWWYQEGGPHSLILMAAGLAASMAIREEALVLVPLVAALVAFRERGWARRAKVATLVAFPGVFVFALWTFANWLIMGNPLFWYEGLNTEASPPGHAGWLPLHKTIVTSVSYAAGYTWRFVPGLVIVLPLMLLAVLGRRRKFWELASVVGAAAVFPGQVAATMLENKSWGDPRYFASLTIFAVVVIALAAREVTSTKFLRPGARRLACLVLVGLGALDAVSGTFNDLNPKTTAVESEFVAFRAAFGLPLSSAASQAWQRPPVVAWHQFDAYIDTRLARGQLILVDTESDFPAVLFSKYPKQWVIPSDLDFQALADNFSGQCQWLLTTPHIASSLTAEIYQALGSTDGGHWTEAKDFGPVIGQLYHWVPKRH